MNKTRLARCAAAAVAVAAAAAFAFTGGERVDTTFPAAAANDAAALTSQSLSTSAEHRPVHGPQSATAGEPVAQSAPVPPTAPTPPGPGSPPSISVNLGDVVTPTAPDGTRQPTSALTTVLLLGAISLLPALLIMMTSFTRIIVVLSLTRSALNTPGVPPNQVLIGLALFISLFIMGPTLSKANEDGVQPYLAGTISQSQAVERTVEPFRTFMFSQVREKDLGLFVKLSDSPQPKSPADVKTTTLAPAFLLSELRTAFLIGFVIFIPFLIIDLVVSAVLSAVGMVMLPPVLISLPFKLLLFVAADGWYLVVESLVRSFQPL